MGNFVKSLFPIKGENESRGGGTISFGDGSPNIAYGIWGAFMLSKAYMIVG